MPVNQAPWQSVNYKKEGNVYVFEMANGKSYNAILSDVQGRTIESLTVSNGTSIDLSRYASQMFFATLYSSNGKYTFKLINGPR